MSLWRQNYRQLHALFSGMAPRQRWILTATPLVLAALLGLALSRGALVDEQAVLGGKDFSTRELHAVRENLRKAGLSGGRWEGNRLYVPKPDLARYEAALRTKGDADAPANGLEKAIGAGGLFLSSSQRQELIDAARFREVAGMIAKLPEIEEAQIVGTRSRPRGFQGESRMTATLSVTPRAGIDLSPAFCHSLQKVVGGALSMADGDVTILNTRTGETIRSPADAPPGRSPGVAASAPAATARSSPPNPQSDGPSASAVTADAPKTEVTDASTSKISSSRPKHLRTLARAVGQAFTWSALRPWAVPATGAVCSLGLLVTLRRRRPPGAAGRSLPTSVTPIAESPPHEALPGGAAPLPASPMIGSERADRAAPRDNSSSNQNLKEPESREKVGALCDDGPPGSRGFEFLQNIPPAETVAFLSDEHPQTIALVLSQLPAPSAGAVLCRLPQDMQFEVARRMDSLGTISAEVLSDVAESIRQRIRGARLIGSRSDRRTARSGSPRQEEFQNDERLRRLKFVFDDLLKLDGSAIPAVFARADTLTWALALKGASEELRLRIMNHLPPAAAESLHCELQNLGPVRVGHIAAAQQQIVELVRRLEDAGELALDENDSVTALRMTA